MTRDLQNSVGTDIDRATLDENKRREVLGIKPVLPQ
jgi:hypothetical protein